jgi:transcriptional regulator with PAS, ATPase and Fis domain
MNEVDITSTNYAIVGYPNLTNIARNLCNMLNLDVEIYTTYSSENVETTLELLKLKGVELILADTINYERAKAYGINAKLVVSGEESIKLAFNEAVKIGKVYRELQLESSLYKSLNLMDDCDNYIFDSNYNLVYSSSNDESDLIKNLLLEKSNELTIGEVSNFFKNHDGKGFHIYIKSVFISKDVYYLIRVKAIALEGSYDKINIIDRKEALEKFLSSFYTLTSSIGDLKESIRLASRGEDIVLLVGEIGTGKTEVAYRIYTLSKYADNPMYIVDYTSMDSRERRSFLHDEASPLYDLHSNFYIKIDNSVPLNDFNQLLATLGAGRICKDNKCILSFKLDFGQTSSKYIEALAEKLKFITISLSPLREKSSDIENLANLYLNEQNSVLGKQIVGFEDGVFDIFKKYSWPQNFIQLWRVLHQLITTCNVDYISSRMAQEVIKNERRLIFSYDRASPPDNSLDLDRSLDEIILDIILITLKKYKGNKTKTAEHLGISRSTLWRYLN